MFKTEDDIGMWILTNVKDKNTVREAADAIYWFVAMVEAARVSEQYSHKDLAHMLLGGTERIDRNKQYVENFLATFYEDEEDQEQVTQQITDLLCNHFGLTD